MSTNQHNRESFGSRWGFILACIGSAVGMGNIWMFPTRVSLYGGGSFLIPYIFFVALIGFTGVIAEMSFGRATRSGPVDAFGCACEANGKRKLGEALGMIPVLGSLAMAIGYTVVMGWIFKYAIGTLTGSTLAPDNVEEYGIALAKAHGAGLTLEDFDKEVASVDRISDEERQKIIESGEYLPSYMWNVNGWLCSKLGLTVKSQTQKTIPTTYKEDIYSSTLGTTVKAGDATGMSAVVTTETEEGITIESECIGKVYSKEDYDKNEWTVYGEPNTTITVARPSTVELTCATIVNRIPDVINAQAGYVTTEKLGDLEYRVKPLNEYVK